MPQLNTGWIKWFCCPRALTCISIANVQVSIGEKNTTQKCWRSWRSDNIDLALVFRWLVWEHTGGCCCRRCFHFSFRRICSKQLSKQQQRQLLLLLLPLQSLSITIEAGVVDNSIQILPSGRFFNSDYLLTRWQKGEDRFRQFILLPGRQMRACSPAWLHIHFSLILAASLALSSLRAVLLLTVSSRSHLIDRWVSLSLPLLILSPHLLPVCVCAPSSSLYSSSLSLFDLLALLVLFLSNALSLSIHFNFFFSSSSSPWFVCAWITLASLLWWRH